MIGRVTALVASVTLLVIGCSSQSPAEHPGSAGAAGRPEAGAGGDAGHAAAGGAGGDTGQGGDSGRGGEIGPGGDAGQGGEAGASSDPSSSGAGGEAGGGQAGDAGMGGAIGTYTCDGPAARFATSVPDHQFGTGQTFGQDRFPEAVLGAPRGGGCCAGSLDVTSLGEGGFVVLAFENNVILDGPGADFIVFENPFQPAAGTSADVFAELGTVSVSQDGETWHSFPCTATAYPYGTCAGWHPVNANATTNSIDPLDPATAGGDAFDLADLGLAWARYVRIEDRLDLPGTFDLDAAGVVHPGCP